MTPMPIEEEPKGYKTLAEIIPEVLKDFKDRMDNPDKYIVLHNLIENRTDEEIIAVLIQAGIKKNSQSWRDYSMAKQILFQDEHINPQIYERQINFITDYLELYEE